MKDQYFGDVNDYRKYGLLRVLREVAGLRLGVWWMLTPHDARGDGRFIAYLAQPNRWRGFDPPLFDLLAATVPMERRVSVIADSGLLGDALFVDAVVPDKLPARTLSFATAQDALSLADLVFVDPDNGLEVPSCPPGRRNSSKYVTRRELAALFVRGQSLLVYQHFCREKRDAFIALMAADLRITTGASQVTCFRTSHVAFFLIAQPAHSMKLNAVMRRVPEIWCDEIRAWHGRDV